MLGKGKYAAVVAPVDTETGSVSIQWGPGTDKSPFTAAVSFEVIRGPFSGERITKFFYFSETISEKSGTSVAQRSMKDLRVCGFTGDDIDTFSDQTPTNEVEIVVDVETFEGRQRSKIAWINQPGGSGFVLKNTLSQGDLKKFSARLKGTLKQIPAIKTKEAVREPATEEPRDLGDVPDFNAPEPGRTNIGGVPPMSDDDIPF